MSLLVVIFTRYPLPGETKTRLIPALGEGGAAKLQKKMTERIFETAERFASACERPVSLEVRHEGGHAHQLRAWLGSSANCLPQSGGDLGARLKETFEAAWSNGYQTAIVAGSDIPGITAGHLEAARMSLRERDVVLGPARDGGYYLIGLRRRGWGRAASALFTNIAWSTNEVLSTTLSRAARANLSVALLDELSDVDRPSDLPVWTSLTGALPTAEE
jgi:hypothetical protein